MRTSKLNWLLAATWAVWFIPWQAKSFFPAVFGSSYFNLASVAATSVILSIGLFISLRSFFTHSERRKETCWTSIGFVTLFAVIIGYNAVASPMLIRVANAIDTLTTDDAMPSLLQKLQVPGPSNKRADIAKAIYHFYGVTVPYQNETGGYVIYEPDEKDKGSWAQTQSTKKKLSETKKILNVQLKQLPLITSFYIFCFFITFFIGIVFLTYKKSGRTMPSSKSTEDLDC
jgi:hypothetical protein